MGNISTLAAIVVCIAAAATAQTLPQKSGSALPVIRADFVFDNAVRRTNDLPTSALRAARRQMISGDEMRPSDLRALADAGDGLAAYRYAQLWQARVEPDTTGIAALYYAHAAYAGRAFAVPPLARLLIAEGANYSPARLKHCLNAMTVQALSGNSVAATYLGQMYIDGLPFGRDLAKAQTFLALATEGGNQRAVLQLGVALMSDPADKATGHMAARSALMLAAAGSDLSVRVTAENLLRLIDSGSAQIQR